MRVKKKTIQVQRVLLSKEKLNKIQFEMNTKTSSIGNIIDRNFNFNFTISYIVRGCSACFCIQSLLTELDDFLAFLEVQKYKCRGSYRIVVLPSTKADFIFWWSIAWMQNNHLGSSFCACDIGCSLWNSVIHRQVNKIGFRNILPTAHHSSA